MTGHKLTTKEKEVIKSWLSMCFSPAETLRLVKENFGKGLSIQAVAYYEGRYKDEVEKNRREFLASVFRIPEAHPIFRIYRLAIIAQRNFLKNDREYRETLKQIAEEVRSMYDVSPKLIGDELEKVFKSCGEDSNTNDKSLQDRVIEIIEEKREERIRKQIMKEFGLKSDTNEDEKDVDIVP